jgi:glycerol-3-phosphate acyltransferase PlsY
MLTPLLLAAAGYAIGSVPVGWLVARAQGVELRARGSGNTGASNIIENVSPLAGALVGVVQIAQGLAPVLLARALDAGSGTQILAGIAAVVANNWNPWLGFSGGRGIGTTLGVLLGTSWAALAAFVAIALVGLLLRAVPQSMALGLLAAPIASLAAGDPRATAIGCAALAAIALTKRLASNEMPSPDAPRPEVWWNRLIYDRDIRDREAWVRRERLGGSG